MIPGPWLLDPTVTHLNHGAFSAVPIPVLEAAEGWRRKWEEETTQFVVSEWEPALDRSRAAIAQLVGAKPSDLVFVSNATAGVNVVVRSLKLTAGDQLLTTDHVYNACRNVLDFAAARAEAEVIVVPVPFPISDPSEALEAVIEGITPHTRFALIDHVTSATGLVLPIVELVKELEGREIPVMIDGAHGPGMVPLALDDLGASFYTGNHHKWLSVPKGSAFLWARADRSPDLVPSVISHGWNDQRTDRPRFHLLFDYPGAIDPSPHFVVPEAIAFLSSLHPEGLDGLMARNRVLAIEQRQRLCDFLDIPLPAPEAMIGALATVPMPGGKGEPPPTMTDELTFRLRDEHQIQVPVLVWPQWPTRLLRISAGPYNDEEDYDRLLKALDMEL